MGPGVSPKTALSLGLKVDADALPERIVQALKAGKVDLDDVAVTLQLLKVNAILGVPKALVMSRWTIRRMTL